LRNTDVWVLDDWGMVKTDAHRRTGLLERIDDRTGRKAAIIRDATPR
jgi:DNA replication protein DnaC